MIVSTKRIPYKVTLLIAHFQSLDLSSSTFRIILTIRLIAPRVSAHNEKLQAEDNASKHLAQEQGAIRFDLIGNNEKGYSNKSDSLYDVFAQSEVLFRSPSLLLPLP